MRNTKSKKARFEQIFGHVSPLESSSQIVEVKAIIKRSISKNLAGNHYYFIHVDKCPICNKAHSYHHVYKEDFVGSGVLNLFNYEYLRDSNCYPEYVFTAEQIKKGYKIPQIKIVVDLNEHREIIKHIFQED